MTITSADKATQALLRPSALFANLPEPAGERAIADDTALEQLFRSTSLPPLLAEDPEAATEAAGFNAGVQHRPAVVVRATSADDVVAAVRFAAKSGLAVAVQGTGHGAVMPIEGAVLVTTSRMQEVTVDPVACTARVGAGVKWLRVIEAASPYGLAAMSGSSSDVGVVGYTLGGGLGSLGRAHGWSADHVRSIDIVTGDGELRHVTADSDPDLFWGLRGGKGNFGVVTALEIDLLPVSHLYAGNIVYAGEHAAAVLGAWREWTATLPEAMSTSIAFMRLPNVPDVPPPLRGSLSVHLRVALSDHLEQGERLLAPMRAAAPALVDTVRVMPYREADSIHQDPTDPAPFWLDSRGLTELPEAAVETLIGLAGPEADLPLLMVELRLLGGALARPAAVPNAVAGRAAAFSVMTLGIAVPGVREAGQRAAARLFAELRPWDHGQRLLNFVGPADPETIERVWEPATAARLAGLASTYDPHGLFRVMNTLPRRHRSSAMAAVAEPSRAVSGSTARSRAHCGSTARSRAHSGSTSPSRALRVTRWLVIALSGLAGAFGAPVDARIVRMALDGATEAPAATSERRDVVVGG